MKNARGEIKLRCAVELGVGAFGEPLVDHALVARAAPVGHGHDFVQHRRRHPHGHGSARRLEAGENHGSRLGDVAAGFVRRRHFADSFRVVIHRMFFLFCSSPAPR